MGGEKLQKSDGDKARNRARRSEKLEDTGQRGGADNRKINQRIKWEEEEIRKRRTMQT